jgi:HlyD family secretion protein
VRDAQAQLDGAQRDVDDATLKAPVAGVVSAINGAVGEFVGAASGTTPQSPGSGAPLPAVASASGTGTTATGGGGPFIVLNDVASFQLVVPFEETDAAKIKPNQTVDVTVDAVPGLTAPGTVLAVAPTGAQSSALVNYNATILLTNGDPGLRDGQTAEAAVTTDSEDNVLRVPSSAVRTEGGRSVVSVPGADGAAVTTPFTPGKVGDEFTQVQSGLSLGQEILLPQAQVTASPATPQQPPR